MYVVCDYCLEYSSVFTVRVMVFMVTKIQVAVFWVVTMCSVVLEYQHFKGPCCLHLQGEVNGAVLVLVALWLTLSVDPHCHDVKPCVGS